VHGAFSASGAALGDITLAALSRRAGNTLGNAVVGVADVVCAVQGQGIGSGNCRKGGCKDCERGDGEEVEKLDCCHCCCCCVVINESRWEKSVSEH
jgi:hypothetical protein